MTRITSILALTTSIATQVSGGEIPIATYYYDHKFAVGREEPLTFQPEMFFYAVPFDYYDGLNGSGSLGANLLWESGAGPVSIDFGPGDLGYDWIETNATNGILNTIMFFAQLTNDGPGVNVGLGIEVFEHNLFSSTPGVDLYGEELQKITLNIHNVEVRNFEEEGVYWTQGHGAASWDFYVVPEPTACSVGLAAVIILLRRSRRRKNGHP